MITPFVMRAFDRLASDAILDVASRATPSPSPSLVDGFMEEAFRLDPGMRSAYEDAKRADAASSADGPSKEELFRGDFERILEGIANGGTSSAKAVSNGDITHLMNMIRFLQRKREGGNDRETKAVGMRDTLQRFREGLSRPETRASTAKEVAEFVEKVFAGEMDWLMNAYLYSRKRGGDLKINLLTQDAGGRDRGKELARMTILGMLLEGTRNSIEKELYANHPSDGAALGAIAAGVHHRINNRQTGDAYDDETAATEGGGKYSRGKWGKYIAPLQDTGKFGQGESLDILGITEFLNEHFLRPDLDSRTPVDAPLPGGGTMTAPSFKTRLKNTDVHLWATGASSGISMDTPIGADEDSGTVGETIGAQDRPREETEEAVVEWLESPSERNPSRTNRDLARGDIRGWITEAMKQSTETKLRSDGKIRRDVSEKNEAAVKDILLVKMGLVSSEKERKEFLDRWLSKDIPHFRAEAIDADVWKDIGEPFKKGWMQGWKKDDTNPSPTPVESPYSKDWSQQALVNKVTGEQFMGRIDALKDESQDNLEVVTKVHKKGDEPKKQHMLNWLEYNQEDRKADLNRALDMYDGEQWFEQSVNEDVRKELERKDETLAEAFRKFRPESIFTAVAKSSDTELIRAMGYVKPSISLESGKTPFKKHPEIYPDIKKAIGQLGKVMVEESENDAGALRYLSLKRLGKVARRTWESGESVILDVVADLMGDS